MKSARLPLIVLTAIVLLSIVATACTVLSPEVFKKEGPVTGEVVVTATPPPPTEAIPEAPAAETRLEDSTLTANGERAFGESVAVSGDTVLVGAPTASDNGVAYVIVREDTDWMQQDKLTASDVHRFGHKVALSGDIAVIGDPRDGELDNGVAHVFVRYGTDWVQQARLSPCEVEYCQFGESVAVSGDTVVVGAPLEDTAYVFVRRQTDWVQQAKLSPCAVKGCEFGWSVSVSRDTIVVGAPGGMVLATGDASSRDASAGAAYVFVREGTDWIQQNKLTVSGHPPRNDDFGRFVAVSEDTILVAAPQDSKGSGAVYVFARNATDWAQQDKLTASNAVEGDDSFGNRVALSRNIAVIGAPGSDDVGVNSGAAYVFVRSGTQWEEKAKLLASDVATLDNFGRSVAVSGDTAVVTGSVYDRATSTAGLAYVYSLALLE